MRLLLNCFSLALLFSVNALAQRKGTFRCLITRMDGSVQYGYLRIDKSRITPSQFEFYKGNSNSGEKELITPQNAKFINIADSLFYRSGFVKVYDNPVDKNTLGEQSDEPMKEGTFFLARLIRGSRVSLFALEDSTKTHYILEDSSFNLQCLRYVRYYDNAEGGSAIIEKTFYKNQLLAYVDKNNEKVRKKIMNTRFTTGDLIAAVMSINNSNQLTDRASSEIKERRIIYPFIEAGLGKLNIDFIGINPNLSAMNFQSKFVAKFIAGVELHLDKKEKLITDFYISIYPYSFSASHTRSNSAGTSVTDTYELKATPVSMGIFVNYELFKIKTVRIALGVGYSLVINKISKNSLTTTDKNQNGSFVFLTQPRITQSIGQYSFDMDVFLNSKMSIRLAYLPLQDFSGLNFNSFRNKMISGSVKFRL